MEMVAEEGCTGCRDCMLANDRGGASTAGAAPVNLPSPQDEAAKTIATPAEQLCKHFSIRGYVALVRKRNPKFCSLRQIFHGQQQYDECPNSLYPFPLRKFRPWDCSECSDKAEISDHRTASRTFSMRQNGRSGGCSVSLVGTTLPTTVDFKSLFPCTQQLPQGESVERSILLKNNPETNCKCNSHSGVPEMNTDPPMKDLHESDDYDVTVNTSDDAFMDATALPEVSEMRANREEHGIAIPSSPKLTEVIVKSNAEQTGTREVLTVDSDTDTPKSVSGKKGDRAFTSVPCEETAPRRSARSNRKKKSCKLTSAVAVLNVKNDRRKQRKVRLLSDIISTGQVAGSRSNIEVDHEYAADLCQDDRRSDDIIHVRHQAAGEMVSTLSKNKAKYKGVDVVDDGSSHMNGMRRVPKKSRTDKKDSKQKVFDSSPNSKFILGLPALKVTHNGALPSIGNLSKKRNAASISSQQGDENIQHNNLQRNFQSTDDTCPVESDNYSQRSMSKVKSVSMSKGKMLSTFDVQHGNAITVSHPAVGHILVKIPRKSRTPRFAKSDLGRVASKDVQSDYVSATNTQPGDEILQINNMERNVQNTYDIIKNVKTTSLSERNIPSTANAKNGDVETENIVGKRAVQRTDDQYLVECSSSVHQHLTNVSPVKRGIDSMSSLEQELHQKRKKQKQEAVHEKQAAIEDIPMDVVELLAKNQGERISITETDCSDSIPTRITEDEDCTIIAAENGQNYASTVPSCTSQQKPLTSQSNQKALQDRAASITHVASTHLPELQMADHFNPTQEQRTHLSMDKVVTIVASSPLLSHDKDQSTAEPPADRSSHERAKKLMWDSFKQAPRDSASTSNARFRSRIEEVNVASTHVAGAYSGHPTYQQVFPTAHYNTNRAVNQVQAMRFPRTISSMEGADYLYDQTNGGQPGFYSNETMYATHLLTPMDPSRLADFPNHEASYRNQMGFPLRDPCYAHNQYKGSASTSHGSTQNGYIYRGSASTSHGSDLNGNQYRGMASTSHLSNQNENVPLTLEDLSRHRLQPDLQTLRPLRPLPRVGLLSSLLQQEIANLSDNHGAESGLRIGVSRGITSLDINRRENVRAFNSRTFSERCSVSAGSDSLQVGNSAAQSWTKGQEKPNGLLDRLVRKDICVINKNPSDISVITDDNDYVRDDLI